MTSTAVPIDHTVDHNSNHNTMKTSRLTAATGLTALVLAGCSFGIFYAWISTTMWGLDDTDPRVAIQAMQAMNANIRNFAFFPPFFLPSVALAAAAALAWRDRAIGAAKLFGAGAVVYLIGGQLLTMAILVPMNEELGSVVVPRSMAAAETIWTDYSGQWQVLNTVRTIFCGTTMVLAALGFARLPRGRD